MKRSADLLFLAVVVLFASGCAKLMLKHTPLTAAAQAVAPVALVVKDSRAPEFGGGDEFYVARLRNLYGMPIKFQAENSMTQAVRALFADALTASGYSVVEGSPVQVEVDIKMFFMDGYLGYKIDTQFDVRVVSAGAVAHQVPISEVLAFSYMSNSDMYAAFDQLMNKIAQDAVAAFGNPAFKTAVAPQ